VIATEQAAQGFAAVGSEPRIEVLQCLVRAGSAGLLFGEIQERLAIPASTLSHHLRFLAAAELIVQQKQGRTTVCKPNFERIEALAGFLLRECCVDELSAHKAKHSGVSR
jgi:DNA-binding transcriptional ArsR family regulator